MLLGTNLTYTKAFNYRIVFETIRLYGPISRADIARQTNLTAQTVSNIVKRLLDTGLIREGTKRQDGRGAPSVTLEINPNGSYSIGLDLNSDHLTGVMVDLKGNVKERIYYSLEPTSPDEAIKLLAQTIKQLMIDENIEDDQLSGIGISFPGPMEIKKNSSVTNVVNPKAFPNWNKVPVVKLLSEYVNVPIFLENNASAAAVGERWYGAGRHASSFLYVFFGAGLGSGLIVNGDLQDGYTGNTGELGYIPMWHNPSFLSDSKHPHIGEHFNLKNLYNWLNNSDSKINVSQPLDLDDLFHNKNKYFMQWLKLGEQMLVPTFLTIEYLIDPEVIFLGGRLPKSIIEHMRDKLSNEIPKHRIERKSSGPDLKCATAGVDAAALGAATLPMFDLFAPQPHVLIKKDGMSKTN